MGDSNFLASQQNIKDPTTGCRSYCSFLNVTPGETCIVYSRTHTWTQEVYTIVCQERFKLTFENLTGKKLKYIRSDNGPEYGGDIMDIEFQEFNSKFDDYCEKYGIIHERTDNYTPEQNGNAERKNRTLVEWTRAFGVMLCYM
jgi:hypothetical protein